MYVCIAVIMTIIRTIIITIMEDNKGSKSNNNNSTNNGNNNDDFLTWMTAYRQVLYIYLNKHKTLNGSETIQFYWGAWLYWK